MTLLTVVAPHEAQCKALREGAGARELPDRAIVVRGEDRASWLAGMVTQDVKTLAPGQSRYAAAVHEKGKLMADLWATAREESLVLWVPPTSVDVLLEHFERHIIMEDVEVQADPALRVVSVQGPGAKALAEGLGAGDGAVVEANRLGRGGLDVSVREGEPLPAWLLGALADGRAVAAGEGAWETARIEAGVPRWDADFDTQNYVQEAAITPRAVSFKKGCYVGQEVVCRLEMRGHVRRQLVALVLDEAGEVPAKGASVGEGGAVTSAAMSTALGRPVAIAMVKWDVASKGGPIDVAGRGAQIVARPVP